MLDELCEVCPMVEIKLFQTIATELAEKLNRMNQRFLYTEDAIREFGEQGGGEMNRMKNRLLEDLAS